MEQVRTYICVLSAMLVNMLLDCQLLPQSPTRSDGEDFIDFMRRIDMSYCGDKFCMESPGPKHTLNSSNSCVNACPRRCQCDSYCILYGDCCPDYQNGTSYVEKSTVYSCLSDFLKPQTGSTNFQVVTNCPLGFNDSGLINMCQKSKVSKNLNFKTFVTSHDAVTYGNAYCALCNGKVDFVIWKMHAICERQFYIPSIIQPNQLVNSVWEEGGCNFRLASPPSRDLVFRECAADETHLISECNVTGQWLEYNVDIESACLNYTHVFEKYTNPFCYICNSATPSYDSCVETPSPKVLRFSARLDFTDEDEYVKQPDCDRGYRYDVILERCREIYCVEGKWLRDEQKCLTVIRPPPNSLYKLSVYYAVDITLHNVHCLEFIPNQSSFSELSDELASRLLSFPGIPQSTKPLSVKTSAMLVNKGDVYCGQDGLYNITAEYSVKWVVFTATLVSLDNIDIDVLEEMLFNSTRLTHYLQLGGFGDVVLTPINRVTNTTDLRYVRFIPMKSVIYWVPNSGIEIEVTKHRTCPFILLMDNEYEVTDNGTLLYIPSKDYFVQPEDYEFVNVSWVRICAEKYFSKPIVTQDETVTEEQTTHSTESLFDIPRDATYSSPKGPSDRFITTPTSTLLPSVDELCSTNAPADEILEDVNIICVCLSVFCLLVTLIVYCMFKPLRTSQGINNMALTTCLLLAQISHIITPDREAVYEIQIASRIATHYLTIATLLWLNVCSLHVLRVFGPKCTTKNNKNVKLRLRTFALYSLYCHLTPAVFVGINIGVSLELFDDIGYNASMCLTSNPYLLGLTFCLPVGIAVFLNTVMFCVFLNAWNDRFYRLKVNSPDVHHPQLYFRLSIIAALTWLCGLLYQYVGYIVYSYLFTFMNTLQGILIFLTCVCNNVTCGLLINKDAHLSASLDEKRNNNKQEKRGDKNTTLTELSSNSSGGSGTNTRVYKESIHL